MRRDVFFVLLLIFSLVVVSAIDTPINLKVTPNSEVSLNVLNPSTLQSYQFFVLNSSESGMASATFSGDVNLIALSFVVRKSGKIVQYIKPGDYGNFSTSSSITIDTLQEKPSNSSENSSVSQPVNVTNTSLTNSSESSSPANETQNISTQPNLTGSITGNTGSGTDNSTASNKSSFFGGIGDFAKKSSKYVLYAFIGILGLIAGVIVFFFIVKFVQARRKSGVFQLKKQEMNSAGKYSEKGLSDAEKRIEQAQAEISKAKHEIDLIKNRKTTVLEAERKFQEAKKELERVRGGF